jgi:hypothetical protein
MLALPASPAYARADADDASYVTDGKTVIVRFGLNPGSQYPAPITD